MKPKKCIDYSVAVAFGTVLKTLRDEKKFSQKKLEALSGIHERSIRRIEHGIQMPALDSIFVLCRCLDIDVDVMMKMTVEVHTINKENSKPV